MQFYGILNKNQIASNREFTLFDAAAIHLDKLTKMTLTFIQEQSSIGVVRKIFSENMQQIYRRTPMPSVILIKLDVLANRTLAWVFSCKFAAYFQNAFFKNTYGGLPPFIMANILDFKLQQNKDNRKECKTKSVKFPSDHRYWKLKKLFIWRFLIKNFVSYFT